ncbi:hypothetical protein SCLCIDRAFT_34478 [Scleroderma citrinum Foug A]|uniref:Uncharacterized protein n=1 Tax=Scleroderma citrinum Foug A TaxID=1036808 RepID=A0A0C3D1F9_9AGAM|nr:hypothetical protein SCLCIDRAFT_34478 [Scleroderma citrinum Foug A]
MSAHPIDWSKVPHTNLVSNLEDDTEVAEAKAGEKQRREEEAKAERQRQKEAQKVEEAQREEAERQRAIDEVWARMEREQQEEMQARARAIMVTQGRGMLGPSTAVVVLIPRACGRCTVFLGEPEGAQGMRLAFGAGGGNCGDRKWDGGEQETSTEMHGQRKKAHTMTEEGEDDEDTEEVFGVLRAMVEEQRDALRMLTQTLAQVTERLAAAGVRDEERLAMEQERMEIRRAHLAIARRAMDRDKERLELERVRTLLAKGKEKEVETGAEAEAEEKGEKVDNEDEDAQGEEE